MRVLWQSADTYCTQYNFRIDYVKKETKQLYAELFISSALAHSHGTVGTVCVCASCTKSHIFCGHQTLPTKRVGHTHLAVLVETAG